jgi:hypothetical protein
LFFGHYLPNARTSAFELFHFLKNIIPRGRKVRAHRFDAPFGFLPLQYGGKSS